MGWSEVEWSEMGPTHLSYNAPYTDLGGVVANDFVGVVLEAFEQRVERAYGHGPLISPVLHRKRIIILGRDVENDLAQSGNTASFQTRVDFRFAQNGYQRRDDVLVPGACTGRLDDSRVSQHGRKYCCYRNPCGDRAVASRQRSGSWL
jgi:hypothetical protein